MNFFDYRIEENGQVMCEPCLNFVFFSNVQLSATEPPDVLAPYRVFLEHFGSRVGYCRTNGNQMHAKKTTGADLSMPAVWLADPKKRARADLQLELRTGGNRDDWRAPCLELDQLKDEPQRTHYNICVPLDDYVQWGLDGVLAYLGRSLVGFPLASGYVGYAHVWDRATPRVRDVVTPYFHRWLQRHPGIMSPDLNP